jgi:prepilin-type N-terminal cleavage/methylation domain-containing protein
MKMKWRDQTGLTLVELLAAIAIMSIIILPIITLMTNSSTRTAIQGKESQLAYFAQEVIEEVKSNRDLRSGIVSKGGQQIGQCKLVQGCNIFGSSFSNPDAKYRVAVRPVTYAGHSFYEIEVEVESTDVVAQSVSLVTVVRP